MRTGLILATSLIALAGCAMNAGTKSAGIDAVERAATFAEHAGKICDGYTYNADAADADRAAEDVKADARIDAAEKARAALKLDIRNGAYSPATKYCKTLDDPAVLADLRYLAENT